MQDVSATLFTDDLCSILFTLESLSHSALSGCSSVYISLIVSDAYIGVYLCVCALTYGLFLQSDIVWIYNPLHAVILKL